MLEFLKSVTAPGLDRLDPMKYRAVLQRQVKTLRRINETSSTNGSPNLLQIGFAASLARDALTQVLPPDSALYALYTATTGVSLKDPPAASGHAAPFETRELHFYELALDNIDWRTATNQPGSLPAVETTYSEVGRMLPGLVQRHWMFKTILAALGLVVVFAGIGVLRFGTLAFDIQKQLDDKKVELQRQVDIQKATLDSMSQQTTVVTAGLASARTNIQTLSTEADAAIEAMRKKVADDSAKQVEGTVSAASARVGEVEKSVKGELGETGKSAVRAITETTDSIKRDVEKAGKERVDYLSKSGLDDVLKRIRDLQNRSTESDKALTVLIDRNADIAGAQKTLAAKQEALSKGLTVAQMEDPALIDRAAVYLSESVTIIRIVMGVLAALVILNMFLTWRNYRLGRRLANRLASPQ
jgi:hypothetical protein